MLQVPKRWRMQYKSYVKIAKTIANATKTIEHIKMPSSMDIDGRHLVYIYIYIYIYELPINRFGRRLFYCHLARAGPSYSFQLPCISMY